MAEAKQSGGERTNIMNVIEKIFESGSNIQVSVAAKDLREFAQYMINEVSKNKNSSKEEEYLSSKKVCELIEIDPSTLWHWEKKGYLVPVRVGGLKRYRKSEINTLLDQRK